MSLIKAHELAYRIESLLTRRLRERRVVKPGELSKELTEKIMDEVPTEAYEPRQASEDGLLFFTGNVERRRCLEAQQDLMSIHLSLPKGKEVNLILTSYGGSIAYGLSVMSTMYHMTRQGRVVNVHIAGAGASMATVILQAGAHRSMESSATLMIHESWAEQPPMSIKEAKDNLEWWEKEEAVVFQLYAQRSGRSVEFWKKLCDRKTVGLTSQEALDLGLVDEILNPPAYRRRRRRAAA